MPPKGGSHLGMADRDKATQRITDLIEVFKKEAWTIPPGRYFIQKAPREVFNTQGCSR